MRLLIGFFVITTFAVVGTIVADLVSVSVVQPLSFGYLVLTTLGLGFGAVIGALVVARYIDQRSLTDYGFRERTAWGRDLVVGGGLALIAQTVAVGVALAAGWAVVVDTIVAGSEGFILGLLGAVLLFAVVGFYEELVARGVILKNVAEGFANYGTVPAVVAAVIISSVVFGIVHLANAGASLVAVGVIAVIAITVAASYVLTGRLGLAIGFHASWNISMGVLFGQPVSGINLPARILALEVTGPTSWTGGAFGFEAGFLGVVAGVVGLVGVIAYVYVVEGRLRIHPDLLVPTLRGRSDEENAAIRGDSRVDDVHAESNIDVSHDGSLAPEK
ncbi:CPBP family intramembrane glutamic endopeptidase [Salinirubrum litoreum]|uniref:CPBP family intramembrane glutamic endopeptidase n=1 Tax=Salinirubrum litoreum TaxID=1126234 RepID=A0ABD5RAU8_9EURY